MHITGDATTGRLGRSFVGGKTHCQVFIAVCVPLGEIYSSIHSRICTGDHCHRERKRKSQILRFSPRATGKGKSIFHSLLYIHWWPLSWTVKEKIQNVRVGLLQSHRRVMAEKRRTKWSIESAPIFFFLNIDPLVTMEVDFRLPLSQGAYVKAFLALRPMTIAWLPCL